MEDFKKLPKMQAFKVGGKVSKKFTAAMEKEFPKGATITPAQDEAEDKKMVKKAVGQHESALHEGEPKTTLKLKCGGRAKKEVGTVQKYCGGKSVKKMSDGKSTGPLPQEQMDKLATEENIADRNIIPNAIEAVKNFGKKVYKTVTKPSTPAPSAPVAKKRGGRC